MFPKLTSTLWNLFCHEIHTYKKQEDLSIHDFGVVSNISKLDRQYIRILTLLPPLMNLFKHEVGQYQVQPLFLVYWSRTLWEVYPSLSASYFFNYLLLQSFTTFSIDLIFISIKISSTLLSCVIKELANIWNNEFAPWRNVRNYRFIYSDL